MKSKITFYVASILTLLATINLSAQDLIDSLSWSTDGEVNIVKIDGNSAYVGGYFSNVGKKVGNAPFFDADNNLPDYDMPIIGDLYGSLSTQQVYTFESDGAGGWIVGGDYDYVDGNPVYFLNHRFFQNCGIGSRCGNSIENEQIRIETLGQMSEHFSRDLLLVNQTLLQATAAARSHDIVQ